MKNQTKTILSTTLRTNKRHQLRKPEEPQPVAISVEEKKEEKIEEEPQIMELSNPCRILEKQVSYMQFPQGRFKPILKGRARGVVFIIDTLYDEKIKEKQQNAMEEEKPEQKVVPDIPEDFIFEETKESDKLL